MKKMVLKALCVLLVVVLAGVQVFIIAATLSPITLRKEYLRFDSYEILMDVHEHKEAGICLDNFNSKEYVVFCYANEGEFPYEEFQCPIEHTNVILNNIVEVPTLESVTYKKLKYCGFRGFQEVYESLYWIFIPWGV